MAYAGQWGAGLGALASGTNDLTAQLMAARKQQSDMALQQAQARALNAGTTGLPPDAPGSVAVPQGSLLSQGIANILKNLHGNGNARVQGQSNNQGGSAGQGNASSAEPPQAGNPSVTTQPQTNQNESQYPAGSANAVWLGNKPAIKKYMDQGQSFEQARNSVVADANQKRSYQDVGNLDSEQNKAMATGMNRARSVVSDLSSMTTLLNAKNSGDNATLDSMFQQQIQKYPALSAMRQSAPGQPLTEQDRAALFNSIQRTVANETNNLLGSNAAVDPTKAKDITDNMPTWTDSPQRSSEKLTYLVNTYLKPTFTGPLDSFQVAPRDQRGNLVNPSSAQAEHSLKNMYKQVFGEEYSPSMPKLVPINTNITQGQQGGSNVYTPQEIQQLRSVPASDPRYAKIQQILSGIK